MVSLFVGRLPSDFTERDLEDIFHKYGRISRCDIKRGASFSFGFIEFEDNEDAYDAIRDVDGMNVDGVRIVVEKAKGSARKRNDTNCFNCGEEGHWARDCKRSRSRGGYRGRYRSRSRSPRRHSRRRYSHSRSRSPYDRRGRSVSYSPPPRRDYSSSPKRARRGASRSPSPLPRRSADDYSPRREDSRDGRSP